MDQLKLKALRAQMNPHFIFNAMNTIQHYINNNDKQQANRYLSTFSDLMRINLEQSKSDKVSLSELIKALQLYIDLEQSRLNNQFTYHIEVDETIDADFTYLPPLLLQPYVENAISHGLKNLVNDPEFDRNGQLIIKFSLEEGYIICTIQDNGVGRQRAEKWRAQSSYWHKPQGMKMTKERVETLAQLKEQELTVDIMDLQDKQGKPQGTRVKIYIPESLTWET